MEEATSSSVASMFTSMTAGDSDGASSSVASMFTSSTHFLNGTVTAVVDEVDEDDAAAADAATAAVAATGCIPGAIRNIASPTAALPALPPMGVPLPTGGAAFAGSAARAVDPRSACTIDCGVLALALTAPIRGSEFARMRLALFISCSAVGGIRRRCSRS